MAEVIRAAKEVNPDILIAYHSDGNVTKAIPELIEVGVEILNPIQPECVNVNEVKRLYGDRLSFWGRLGTQTTLPFGTADDVRKNCRELIETVGRGGGFLLAPTHTIEPEVPWDNIRAFLDTVNEHNASQGF
jgi:uroporphyrinogen decarboxylase